MNMVATLTGAAAGGDGTSDSITSPTDRTVLGVIRRAADVVVVGAATVRAEGYVVPRTASLAIVSRTGRIDGHRLAAASVGRVVLLVPESAAASPPEGVEVVRVGPGPDIAPREVLASLAERGWRRVVCEGGPALAAQFAAAGLIDEYCVTVAPSLTPAERPFLPLGTHVETDVAGMIVDEAGFSYLRLRARRGGAANRR
ncbi:hypothetical protein F6B42_08700 [Microbacterium radiodurans]|uniref:Bacterial bifunctional deaminase-reductase C-terminal domain-containing protein n=2 Tax=Microbacterium radiodurans TaxID=661398 RepID=A0A5J5IU15_9MICO|nr:hypothetical protein F6B42_08700 [Microbacterium radiodurans]